MNACPKLGNVFFLYTPENMSVSRKSVLFVRESVVG